MLSSAHEAMSHSSLGFQAKSEILDVWPPWMNWEKLASLSNIREWRHQIKLTRSSGGPSSASSVDWGSPIRLKSHTCSLRSPLDDARIVSLNGAHCTWYTWSRWPENVCNFEFRFLKSHKATVWITTLESWRTISLAHVHTLSAEPVARIHSLKGLKERQ